MIQKLIRYRIAILFSLFSWAFYGMTTNSSDVTFYGLYQVGAESLIEFNTYTIGHSLVAGWKDAGDGDVFEYHHQRFPAKQPGAFFATATPYFFLHHFLGLNFIRNQELVSALNSWFSAGLIGAIGVGAFYELLVLLGFRVGIAIVSTFTFAFCTIFFPYTGIPHHDIMASVCLIFGFFFLTRFKKDKKIQDYRAAGSFLGLTLFFSMLPALIVALLIVYGGTLTLKKKEWFHFGIGLAIGYLPLAIFNTYYFGGPFIQANVAGNYQDTFFKWSTKLMQEHFHDYFGVTSFLSATQMMPVFCLGIFGIFALSKRLRKEAALFFSLLIIHCGYLLNITTIGHCQFGPRYLIPLIPFMMIGFAALLSLRKKWVSITVKTISGIAILYSLLVNTLGAIGDTMYCGNLVWSPITNYWRDLTKLLNDSFLIVPYSEAVLVIAVGFLIWSFRNRNALPVNGRLPELH